MDQGTRSYLVFSGATYYPGAGLNDLRKSFPSYPDALEYAVQLIENEQASDWAHVYVVSIDNDSGELKWSPVVVIESCRLNPETEKYEYILYDWSDSSPGMFEGGNNV